MSQTDTLKQKFEEWIIIEQDCANVVQVPDVLEFLSQLESDYVMVKREPTVEIIQDMHYEQVKYERSGKAESGLARKLYEVITNHHSETKGGECDKG